MLMTTHVEPATIMMCKGMAVLLLVVTIGIAHVEREMNELTHRQEFVQVLNIRRSPLAEYSAYVLGASISGQAGLTVGHIETDTHILKFRFGGQAISIPTTFTISAAAAATLWQTWTTQFQSEAARTYAFLRQVLEDMGSAVQKLVRESVRYGEWAMRQTEQLLEELAAFLAAQF